MTQKTGILITIYHCPRCYAQWTEADPRSDDCAKGHPFPCCGATVEHSGMHEPGCTNDPAFKREQKLAIEREQRSMDAFFASDCRPDGTPIR